MERSLLTQSRTCFDSIPSKHCRILQASVPQSEHLNHFVPTEPWSGRQTCNAQFSYFDPPIPQNTPSVFFLFKKFEHVDLFQDSRSLASCIFHFTFVKRWQSDKWILYITVVNYGYLVSSDKPVTPVIQIVNFGLAGIKMHKVDGFEVVTSSNMWLSMVAGTTLAILLYCAGATASIVYALYNAPTFYKECFYDVSIYCYHYIDIRIYIVFLYIYIYT